MSSNSNMLSNESILNTEIKNKGFALLDQMFKENSWHLVKNEMNYICYTKLGHETDTFEIKIDAKNIHIGIFKNSKYNQTKCNLRFRHSCIDSSFFWIFSAKPNIAS